MIKLLLNYLRDQKNNWLQVLGLGFLIIIMIASFLSLTFAATYVNDDYKKNIVGDFHQEIEFGAGWNPKFKSANIENPWLENIAYTTQAKDQPVVYDDDKMAQATFQLLRLDDNDNVLTERPTIPPATGNYYYRFYFYNETNDNHIYIGKKFHADTNKSYIDFKLSIPYNYPSLSAHDNYVKNQAAILDQFVYYLNESDSQKNKTNFFILNGSLGHYNNVIKPKYPYATRDYTSNEVALLPKIYYYLTMGMLWGDNLTWDRATVINDLLISGKTLAFIQTIPNMPFNQPILVSSNNGETFNPTNLNDNEILIYKRFAKENNLSIGQDYYFSGYKFKIVGFATSALAANNSYYFNSVSDNKNQTIAFINQATFEKITSNPLSKIRTNAFIGLNPEQSAKQISDKINNDWLYQYFHHALINDQTINKSELYGITNAVHSYMLFSPLDVRIQMQNLEDWPWSVLHQLSSMFTEIASVFLVLIFIIASVIIFIVVFKMIDRNKQLIGILKANGYQSWKLSIALVLAIILPIILFAIIAVGLSVVISHFIVQAYGSTMMIVNYGYPFYWVSSLLVIIIPIIALFIISTLLVSLLLRVNALTLINNSWAKSKYHFKIGNFFKGISVRLMKNISFQNKLAITTTFRSFGKAIFVSLVSIFASTLLLFSLSASGLVNNILGLQFAAVNYRFNSQYKFSNRVYTNFVDVNNQLLYKKESINDIKRRPSLYLTLYDAVKKLIDDPDPSSPINVDFRYGYLRGSELLIVKNYVDENLSKFPQEFQDFWDENKSWIEYLTNNNGQNEDDLIINFGLLAYDEKMEAPYSEFNLGDAHDFDVNTIDTSQYYFNNDNHQFEGDWSKLPGAGRSVQGITNQSDKFLTPGLRNTSLLNFSNLTLERMENVGGWLNNNFLQARNAVIDKLKIDMTNPDNANSVKIIPMIGSTAAGVNEQNNGDGDKLGKTVLYRFNNIMGETQNIIGIIYDGARNLLPNIILMPNQWLNEALFSQYPNSQDLIANFATSKFTNFSNNELLHYLPIISENNDYVVNLKQITEPGYLTDVLAISPGLGSLYDVNAVREIMKAQQYSYQLLILIFAVFCVILSFMIIIIISNINIRDNLILINILRSLGYSSNEVAYIFLIVMIPLLVIFSLFAVLIAPLLTGFLANTLLTVIYRKISVVFLWWYYVIPVFIVILIYLISFIITWKLNVNNRQLMNLTK